MNDKITFPRLSALLADKSGRSKRFSEDFLREFFALISETLETGESVKVKGLGTFRLARVEPRKSVDVTTGQPMEISGHSKVVFIPAKELADAVNAPFEAFTAIEIEDDTDLSQIFSKDEIELQKQPEYSAEEPDAEEAGFVETAVQTEVEITDNEPTEFEEKYEETSDDASETVVFSNSVMMKTPEESDNPDFSDDAEGTEEATDEEIQVEESDAENAEGESDAEYTEGEYGAASEPEEEEEYDDEDLDPGKFRKRNWKRAILISFGAAILALVATFAIWYVFATNDFNKTFNPKVAQAEQPTILAAADIDSTAEDAEDAEDSTLSDTGAEESAVSPSPIMEESEVPTAPSDAVVYDTISTTRYLTTMAKAHYGNFNLWPFIYEENKAILGHPDRIRPGTPVVIPKLSKYGVDASNKDDIEKAKKMGVEIYARFGKKI